MSFDDLLAKDGGCTNHFHNIHLLMIEMYKAQHNLEPILLKDVFEVNKYMGPTLRTDKYFKSNNVKSDSFGLNSLQVFGVRLWKLLPENIRLSQSLEIFKEKIKSWKPMCPCKLCATFIKGVGYINLQIYYIMKCLKLDILLFPNKIFIDCLLPSIFIVSKGAKLIF